MLGERWHAEVDGIALAAQDRVDLGELVLGAGEADLEALDLASPALALGFGGARSRSPGRSCRTAPRPAERHTAR